MAKKVKPIYTYFSEFPKEMVDEVIKGLSEEEKEIIRGRYGDDLENPKTKADFKQEDSDFFYRVIYPKIRRHLHSLNDERNGKISKRKIKTIYELLPDYRKEEIDEAIATLNDNQKEILRMRYGSDLENPQKQPGFTRKETTILHSIIIPRLKARLSKNNTRKGKKEKCHLETSQVSINLKTKPQKTLEIVSPKEEQKVNNLSTKEELKKTLEMLSKPSFITLLKILTPKEAIILSLRIGLTGIAYEVNDIAEFLDIDAQDVYDTTNKALVIFQENVDMLLDNEQEKKETLKLTKK